ncbi:tuliposide A-converting enzyme 1, chloroplastic-like [Phalaenopsis equestris]|uniref:tuliposide A-converting enzyme 1, chloroplastic-like n=1 Tax=Phalaenopsis equestris TaxID=78828 RepID=UPI0009E1E0EC|nr:tuliposide A-converting enzyme 1, chloroplastic-like [Phalaenopsis equestris]
MSSTIDEIDLEFFPFIRLYKSGRIERLTVLPTLPPSPSDPITGVASKDVVIDPAAPVSARLYLPQLPSPPSSKVPLLVYFHGGAFCIESAFSPTYHPYLNSLCGRAGVLIVSVEYRLAPEHPLPAAYDDSWAALRWAVGGSDPWIAAHADLNRVFLAGDSAGANIAHRMAVRAGAEGGVRVEGTAAIHPYFSTGEEEKGTLGDKLWRLVCPGAIGGTGDPRLNPAAESEGALKGMAGRRAVVFLAEKDFLREKGKAYFEVLRGSGWEGLVELVETEGEGHVFHLSKPESYRAGELMEKLVSFLNGASH